MKPGRLQPIILQRGLYWPGFAMDCYADAAEATLRDLAGWTPFMDVRLAPGKPVVFSFELELGETQGRVIVQPKTGEQTAALGLGNYQTELAFRDDEGRALGPFAAGEVKVIDPITIPPAA